MIRTAVAITLIGLFSAPAYSQPLQTVAHGFTCTYASLPPPETLARALAEDRVEHMIQRIVDASGLAKNFKVYRQDGWQNAAATNDPNTGERIIIYGPEFLRDTVEQSGTRWAAISIIAHEVGHHLNGHTLQGGSRPDRELEADSFSGFILQRLGASLEQSKAAMSRIASPFGSSTHPARPARLTAIEHGWKKACLADPDCMIDADPSEDLPK